MVAQTVPSSLIQTASKGNASLKHALINTSMSKDSAKIALRMPWSMNPPVASAQTTTLGTMEENALILNAL